MIKVGLRANFFLWVLIGAIDRRTYASGRIGDNKSLH